MFRTHRERGILLVISGPSGVGKGTVIHELLERTPTLKASVSVTTRQPRPGEIDGVSYHFRDHDTFMKLIGEKEVLEYDEYYHNYYGTLRTPVMERLEQGLDTVMDITVPGALRTLEMIPEAVSVFLFPPSLAELHKRLAGRGSETEESLRHRFDKAIEEISMSKYFDYLVVNDSVKQAGDVLSNILEAEKHRRVRLSGLEDFIANL